MKKDYQTRAAAGAAQPGRALPDSVTVAMGDLAETLREACSPWPSAPGCR